MQLYTSQGRKNWIPDRQSSFGMNGNQITLFSLRKSASVLHRLVSRLFKGAHKICRCFCFCLAKLNTVCMQTFTSAILKLEIPKKIWLWNLSIEEAKAEAYSTSGSWGAVAGEMLPCARAVCRTRSAMPAARQSTGGQRLLVSPCTLAAHPLWEPTNHCTSLLLLPHVRIRRYLISCESSFLLLIM